MTAQEQGSEVIIYCKFDNKEIVLTTDLVMAAPSKLKDDQDAAICTINDLIISYWRYNYFTEAALGFGNC